MRRSPLIIGLTVLVAAITSATMVSSFGDDHSGESERAACSPTKGTETSNCHATLVTGLNLVPLVTNAPVGLGPDRIKAIYNYPTSPTAGAGKTIAIVVAFDAPTVENDLNVFSAQYGLPLCTTANGCFKKVGSGENRRLPQVDTSWAVEASLDTQWAHAIAPGAKILLVEAQSDTLSSLMNAVDYAKGRADYVSMSWGTDEFRGQGKYDSEFSEDGVSFFASAGDSGLIPTYPATAPGVIAVGGTSLHFTNSVFTSETGWSFGGGGCSAFESASSYQLNTPGYSCKGKRSTPDVSFNADPFSGVAIYDSTPFVKGGTFGWYQVGGTSVSAPAIAARAAVTGVTMNAKKLYSNTFTFRDIVTGGDANSCAVGFDLCSGRGSWIG